MKKTLNVFLILVSCFFAYNSYATNSNPSLVIKATENGGTVTTVTTPASLLNIQGNTIKSIEVILTGTISSYTVTEPAASNYNGNNWGIVFQPASGSPVICTAYNGTCGGATITVNSNGLPTLPSALPYVFAGSSITLDVTITFTNPTTTLPNAFVTLLGLSPISVGYTYNSSTATGGGSIGPDTAAWQADQGALINGPTFQTNFESVKALETQFQILNIVPPAGNAACPTKAAAPTVCVNDGNGASSTGMISTSNNSVTGYVVGIWNESTCSNNSGTFLFDQNWEAYNYQSTYSPLPACNYSLIAYSQNIANDVGGDTVNSTNTLLGCASVTPASPFYTGAGLPTALTPDSGAIPYLGGGNPKTDLQQLISNPGKLYPSTAAGSCISYVYLPVSNATFTSSQINKNDIYGIVAWALNSAISTDVTNPTVPNYSLNHSNVVYTTTANFILASTSKDSGLGLTTDCFVVTAASGNPNSLSVLYWRLLRDAYLTPIGFTKFYYKHARVWAHWLDQHPALKPPLNFIFEKSGYGFYKFGKFVQETTYNTKTEFHKFINYVSNLFDNKASAQELIAFDAVPQDNQNNKSEFGFDQDSQQNIDVVPEDMNGDPFFTPARKKSNQQPDYDFAIKGGILIPTQDKEYYDAYYSSQPTMYAEVSLARLFWTKNIGYSMGLQGRYLTNSQQDSASVLGSQESYTRTFYAVSGEAILGIRYRNPNFTYLQPGLFAGGGLTRFRETASASGSTSSGSQGVTEFSPIYEGGVTLDLSLSAIAGQTELDVGDVLNEVLLRFSASYNQNPSQALSSTGYFVGAGFAFLIN